MAEAWLRHCLAEKGAANIQVFSAGTAATTGAAMSPQAGFALWNEGIRVRTDAHRSRQVDRDLARSADLILTMTRGHARSVRERFPEIADRVRTLLSYSGADGDIQDPFGGSVEDYVHCLARMKPALETLAERLAPQSPPRK
ncbi:MAG: low molecular weight protein arginine phosphatase [Kiritimatiellaeota bacterium]|nr:low molecular weight protein arginine phosphatase [Kiritimatiellota bacterium]